MLPEERIAGALSSKWPDPLNMNVDEVAMVSVLLLRSEQRLKPPLRSRPGAHL